MLRTPNGYSAYIVSLLKSLNQFIDLNPLANYLISFLLKWYSLDYSVHHISLSKGR